MQTQNFVGQIGEAAGQIYNYLYDNGEVSLSKMKKELDLSGNFTELGLGWLSREDKIDFSQKAKSVMIKLR
ncbi:winged helix-turn-helix domain-containing protein [bacterium]|nr:winged helix-turn-helix domain-containing protein [bacterium]